MNAKKTYLGILIMAAVALVALVLSGCQGTLVERPSETAAQTPNVEQHTSGRRTISSATGAPLAGYFVAPQSMQDLINRHDVAFTGTFSAVGDPIKEKPYDWDPAQDAHFESRGLLPFRVRVTYYEITLGEVFLDDGNLRDDDGELLETVRLRLFGDHNPMRPQVGEKFFFVLGSNPDGSYGVNADWNLIHLDGGAVRNFDNKDPGYEGVTDEASLKSAAQTAAQNRVKLLPADWPVQAQWLDDEEE